MRHLRSFYSAISCRNASRGYIRISDGRVLFFDVLDLHAYEMILPQLVHYDNELLLSQTLIQPGGVFVDIGANVGVLSLFALTESVKAVHSFEPNSSMVSHLKRTRATNPLAERWYIHESAVGSSVGYLTLNVNSEYSGTTSFNDKWAGDNDHAVQVPMTTLDHWCKEEEITSVDAIKIDVEGWEFEVMLGASETVEANKPYIWFEHNLPALRQSGQDPNQILNRLQEFGYDTFADIGQLPLCQAWSRHELNELRDRRINILAIPQERSIDFSTRVLAQIQRMNESVQR